MKKLCVTAVAVFVLLMGAACSSPEEEFDLTLVFGNHESEGEAEEEEYEEPAVPVDIFTGYGFTGDGFDWRLLYGFDRSVMLRSDTVVSPFYGETLTILIDRGWHGNRNMRARVSGFERIHPGARVEFVFRDELDYDCFHDLMDGLMNGYAPAIIQASTVGYPFHEHADYFADWMPVLANHPDFNEDDWNMNVLSASFINGELIAFPAFQLFHMVAANKNIGDLVGLFEWKDGITIDELLSMYVNRTAVQPGLVIFNSYTSQYMPRQILFHLHNFFDFGTGKVAFDTDEFVDLLMILQYEVYMTGFEPVTGGNRWEVDAALGGVYFSRLNWGINPIAFDIHQHESRFANPLPVLTNDGALRIESSSAFSASYSWILSASEPVQQAMAAEFLLYWAGVFGLDPANSPFYARNSDWVLVGIPAKQNGYAGLDRIVSMYHQALRRQSQDWRDGVDTAYVSDMLGGMLADLAQMEMRRHNVMPMSLLSLIQEEISNFQQGIFSARDTALRLQARVENALVAGG